jgi:alkyl hydroperoxide reductase subunit AhpC
VEDAQILGVSTDSKFSHLAWINRELGELNYPLLADFTKQVSMDYGVLLERLGAALRGTFIIDPDGRIRAYSVQDLTVGRSVDEILRLLSALKTGELTPVGWRPGEPFIPPIPKNTRK